MLSQLISPSLTRSWAAEEAGIMGSAEWVYDKVHKVSCQSRHIVQYWRLFWRFPPADESGGGCDQHWRPNTRTNPDGLCQPRPHWGVPQGHSGDSINCRPESELLSVPRGLLSKRQLNKGEICQGEHPAPRLREGLNKKKEQTIDIMSHWLSRACFIPIGWCNLFCSRTF